MEQNKTLGKLLARENITIQHGNYNTAWFDIKNRTLGLPMWADNGKDVYDLLIGHEVGHALFTPFEGWHDSPEKLKGCPRSYINVIEDARIERKIRSEYPGLVGPFLRGYKKLCEDNFFGDLDDVDFNNVKLIDKINLKSKLGSYIEVPFNAEEKAFFDRAMSNETFSEVVDLCREILAYTKENHPEQLTPPPAPKVEEGVDFGDDSQQNQPPQGHDDMDPQDSEETDSEEESQGGASNEESDDADDESENSEAKDSEDEDKAEDKASSESVISDKPEASEEDTSQTDDNFRRMEEGLIEKDSKGAQVLHINAPNKQIRELTVISHKQLAKERLERREIYNDNTLERNKDKFDTYIKQTRKNVNFAVKEFEMRKAAHQWQRAATAKSGSLDVNKVHSYKFNEDIFARVTNLADAKNHGMMMLVDYSGSMTYSMSEVMDQVIHLVMFCKAVNIPFEVYGFTTGNTNFQWSNGTDDKAKAHDKLIRKNYGLFRDGMMDLDRLSLPQLVTSELKKADLRLALQTLHSKMQKDDYWNEAFESRNEQYGSTPLNQALIVSHDLIKKFKAKHGIEKMNFVVLTDGDTNGLSAYNDRKLDDKKSPTKSSYYGDNGINVLLDNKLIHLKDSRKGGTKDLLLNIQKKYNTNTLGFFLAEDSRMFHNRIAMGHTDDNYIDYYSDEYASIKTEANKEYRKNKCVIQKDVLGYNEYYVIKTGKGLTTEADEKMDDLSDDATKNQIRNAFKKDSKSKKVNKVLLTSLGKAVA